CGCGRFYTARLLQTFLGYVLASLSIVFANPLGVGDCVVFNDVADTIEHVGLTTTRIRRLSGEQIVCENAQLLQQTIHNYKRMQTRRIVFTFGVAPAKQPEKLPLIGDMEKKNVNDVGGTKCNRTHLLAMGRKPPSCEWG
ncbi:mechanosensitive ion channel family protein, partial [Salmonella enterica]|uniref:mechanosensitive ion channel family protein n=1 Tax=Salmonella enterica TaxID=28901 RepID=UPI00398C68F0